MGTPRANNGSPTVGIQEAASPTAHAQERPKAASPALSRTASTSSIASSLSNSMTLTDSMLVHGAEAPASPKNKLSQSFPPIRHPHRRAPVSMAPSVVDVHKSALLKSGLPPRHGKPAAAITALSQELPDHLVVKIKPASPKPLKEVRPPPAPPVAMPKSNPFVDPDAAQRALENITDLFGAVDPDEWVYISREPLPAPTVRAPRRQTLEEFSARLLKEMGDYKCDASSKYKELFCAVSPASMVTAIDAASVFIKKYPGVVANLFSNIAASLYTATIAYDKPFEFSPFEKVLDQIKAQFEQGGDYHNRSEFKFLKGDIAIVAMHLHAKSLALANTATAPATSAPAAAAAVKSADAVPASAGQSYSAMFCNAASKAAAVLISPFQTSGFTASSASFQNPGYMTPAPGK